MDVLDPLAEPLVERLLGCGWPAQSFANIVCFEEDDRQRALDDSPHRTRGAHGAAPRPEPVIRASTAGRRMSKCVHVVWASCSWLSW